MSDFYQNEMSLDEMEEYLYENDFTDIAIEDEDETMQLIVKEPCIFIPELELYLRSGTVCNWNEKEEQYLADFDVTVVYEVDSIGDCVYYEQDGFMLTVLNYLNASGRSSEVRDINQLRCCLAKVWNIEHAFDEVA